MTTTVSAPTVAGAAHSTRIGSRLRWAVSLFGADRPTMAKPQDSA